ncbi:Ribosomal biogenesis regulatory protein [Phytophthora cactorum]|nr:Ribosomal biogenesis regulatory protein [Phytophthora cactorum]
MVVKASEIAPAAYAEGSTSNVQKEDDLTYDLGNLRSLTRTRSRTRTKRSSLFMLMSDMGPLAQLPVPETVIPREKPLPKPKVETKWEKFAKEKGIDKRKKSRKVFDEASGDVLEMNEGLGRGDEGGDTEDPWTKRKQDKRARVDKNLRAQANNLKQGRGKQLAGLPAVPPLVSPGTNKTLEKVQFSTASMGKFDKMREGESERKVKGKRNHFLPTTGAETTEKERSMNALKRVLGREENAGKNKGKTFDDEEEVEGGKRKKKGKKLKNFTKGATKKRRTK